MNYLSYFSNEDKLKECIARSVKKIRLENNLTQERFAEKLEVSIEHISRIENCKYTCSIMLILKICTEFKIDLHDFFSIAEGTNDSITNYLRNLSTEKFNAIVEFCKEVEKCRGNS